MKEFIARNKPVFTIGIVTLVIFLAIIGIAQTRKIQAPSLVEVEDSETETTLEPEAFMNPEPKEKLEADAAMDERIGVLEIEYTQNGFRPKNTKAVKGQLVRWINTTKEDIYLEQLMKVYEELEDPVLIKAGGIFEFRLTVDRLWTFQEKETKSFGSIFVLEGLL